ncbi:uncharacterized protein LOC110907865 [Helianthus annuus]|uniref:uncharacterized protein LOC110907865 n=1 Tax=Helianthus annuus TaxID=4232 RepID=UPI000B8EFBA9|nr:uncharacterized protein LOC110907865 [Helianthus annuus]
MSSSSTSAVIRKPKVFKVDLDGNLYCHHDVVAVLRVAGRKSERHGQEFYGCSHWPRGDCKFFLWKEDVDKMFVERSYGTSTQVTFKDLKIKNLELHNMLLIEENKNWTIHCNHCLHCLHCPVLTQLLYHYVDQRLLPVQPLLLILSQPL